MSERNSPAMRTEANETSPWPDSQAVSGATPAMARFLEIKARHTDALLFYRMGDFYELFFDDAVAASAALGLTLTKRGRHEGADIAMCGVPVRSADTYLKRLVEKGFKVAVCEQIEDPAQAKKRGAKAVIEREVVRLVTPGTLTEEALLSPGEANHLVVLWGSGREDGDFALAGTDLSTGDIFAMTTGPATIGADIARLSPAELLVSERIMSVPAVAAAHAELGLPPSISPQAHFDPASAERRLGALYGVAALDGFAAFTRGEISALGGLLSYLEATQVGRLPLLKPPRRLDNRATLQIDPATRANLELLSSPGGGRDASLLAAIDRTRTSAGARLLRERLAAPLTDRGAILERQDAVAFLLERPALRARLRERLAQAGDLARALSRIALRRAGPRDLIAVGEALAAARTIADELSREAAAGETLDPLGELAGALANVAPTATLEALAGDLARGIGTDTPLSTREGGFIQSGFSAELDDLHRLRDDSRGHIAALEAEYRAATQIAQLRIKHNSVIGYFIETSPAAGERLLKSSALFHHRQTLAGAMRFSTPALADLASAIEGAGVRALALELALFEDFCARILAHGKALHAIAGALAVIDVALALSVLADDQGYVRPLIDDSRAFEIEAGRHPVVEQAIARSGAARAFTPNGCNLTAGDGAGLWLVTGPNMAGKSTFLRQNALIAVLAQMGSFVPAARARIGIIDRLFSRVGASDDLARGRSTFMVEMVETAAILNQAGDRSFVILDEIGRGTATYDGLAIAWSVLEHLHDETRCRALFATHYHELTGLCERLARLKAVTTRVREHRGQIHFLHEIVPGTADRSYGVQVARLAGLPRQVIARAKALLAMLEAERGGPAALRLPDLPLFALAEPAATPLAPQADHALEPGAGDLIEALAALDPDALSPRDALDALYRLKAIAIGGAP